MAKETGYDQALREITSGRANGHALWVILTDEHQRDGFALKPSPWEGAGEYQHVSFNDGPPRLCEDWRNSSSDHHRRLISPRRSAMPTPAEASAIAAIFVAANKLSNDYARSGGAENRRDQIKAFLASAIDAAAALAAAYDDELTEPAYIQADKESVCQSVDVAFYDAVDAEEAAEPRIDPVREWGTYNARAL